MDEAFWPCRGVAEHAYCPRLFYYMTVEGVFVPSHDAIVPTPFCFIRGSGQQFFLDTVRQLMERVTHLAVWQTLFEPWAYRDEKLSMRWDPAEDRRYALMDRDPTASDNKSRTAWMANLLAYRALPLFPCMPGRRGLAATAWPHR